MYGEPVPEAESEIVQILERARAEQPRDIETVAVAVLRAAWGMSKDRAWKRLNSSKT